MLFTNGVKISKCLIFLFSFLRNHDMKSWYEIWGLLWESCHILYRIFYHIVDLLSHSTSGKIKLQLHKMQKCLPSFSINSILWSVNSLSKFGKSSQILIHAQTFCFIIITPSEECVEWCLQMLQIYFIQYFSMKNC